MDRKDFGFKQIVTAAEMDASFDQPEQSLWDNRFDDAISGVITGTVASLGSSPTVDITEGIAIDKLGRRVRAYSDAASTKNHSYATDTAGGATSVASGNERWISIFARFGRKKSDPRTDGNGNTFYFQQEEFLNATGDDTDANVDKFYIVAGAEAAAGTATKPALHADAILVCDIKRTFNDASNVLDASRREIFGIPAAKQPGTGSGLAVIMGALTTWLGGRTNAAQASLSAQIDKIITDLSAQAAGDDGAERIGAEAYSWLNLGSLRSQINQIADDAGRKSQANTWTGKQTVTPGATTEGVGVPEVASGRVLLFESDFASSGAARLRVYLNNLAMFTGGPLRSIVITLNAKWDGSEWDVDNNTGGEDGNCWAIELATGYRGAAASDSKSGGPIVYRKDGAASFTTWDQIFDFTVNTDPAGTAIAENAAGFPTGTNSWNLFNGEYKIGLTGSANKRRYYFGLRAYGTTSMEAGPTVNFGSPFTGTPSSITVTTEVNTNCGSAAAAASAARYSEIQSTVTADGEFRLRGYVDVAL